MNSYQGSFKDHFSNHANDYAAKRPTYPDALFAYLASLCNETTVAWDCACGNGQASIGLANYFDSIIATDASQEQIEHTEPHPNISYQVYLADNTTIPDNSIDLITIAQGLHWFNFETFYQEVKRVSKPNTVIAAWCYELQTVSPEIDKVIRYFYDDIIGNYWPPERQYIEEAYATLPFPFHEIKSPPFTMTQEWTLNQILEYLDTWSAVQKYKSIHRKNPIETVKEELISTWQKPEYAKTVIWPLHCRIGYVHEPAQE